MSMERLKRKNISCTPQSMHDIAPILEVHRGNFSMAMREVIEFANFAVKNCGSISRAREMINLNAKCNDLQPDDQVVMKVVKVIRRK